jgi:hypothetical protein
MKKISLYIEDKALSELKKESVETGAPVSVLIRRSVEEFLKKIRIKYLSVSNKKVGK